MTEHSDNHGSRLYDTQDSYFLDSKSAKEAIIHLSQADDLVVFCGAGVSIDRTGLNWTDLVKKLLQERCKWTAERASDLSATMDPLQLASMAMEDLTQRHDDYVNALDELCHWLGFSLYPAAAKLPGGNSTPRLLELAAARARQGKETFLVTTNYDITLEEALSVAKDRFGREGTPDMIPPPQILTLTPCSDFTRPCECSFAADELASSEALIKIIYLHGRVPRDGGYRGKIVFTEYDYMKTRSCVETNLASIFDNRNVLILGSSLRDAPLLQALMATRACTKQPKFDRFAILPMAYHFDATRPLTQTQGLAIHETLPTRMKPYDTKLLTPDFYSQVWQFIEEVRLATTDPQAYPSAAARSAYSKRLAIWWEAWQRDRLNVDLPRSMEFYREVMAVWKHVTEILRGIDGGDPQEAFKLEVWFRNQQQAGKGGRTLELWVSSSGILANKTNPRRARLSIASDYAAVRTYQFGRPTLTHSGLESMDPQGGRSPMDPRWATFFSVPLDAYIDDAYLPVGVVTLASSVGGEASKLALLQDRGKVREQVATEMAVLGQTLLDPREQVPRMAPESETNG